MIYYLTVQKFKEQVDVIENYGNSEKRFPHHKITCKFHSTSSINAFNLGEKLISRENVNFAILACRSDKR